MWAAISGKAFTLFLGLAGGIAVGSSLVALLVVFDLIPRLAQIGQAYSKSAWFESALLAGAVYWTAADFLDWQFRLPYGLVMALPGLLDGIFVGMLVAALAEIMNVLPILARRLHISEYLVGLLMAMVVGKIIGSLFDWLIYQW